MWVTQLYLEMIFFFFALDQENIALTTPTPGSRLPMFTSVVSLLEVTLVLVALEILENMTIALEEQLATLIACSWEKSIFTSTHLPM